MDALEYELDRVRKRYKYAFQRLSKYAGENELHKEIIRRALSSRVLNDAMGSLNKYGYDQSFTCDGPLGRMEFLVFFIGHELLDDGDPGLGWHKYNLDTGIMEMCDPPKSLEPFERYSPNDPNWNAHPFWHCCHEILPPGSKHLYEEEVLWVLDWHEKFDELRYERHTEEREPEDPMLISLANKIIGDG